MPAIAITCSPPATRPPSAAMTNNLEAYLYALAEASQEIGHQGGARGAVEAVRMKKHRGEMYLVPHFSELSCQVLREGICLPHKIELMGYDDQLDPLVTEKLGGCLRRGPGCGCEDQFLYGRALELSRARAKVASVLSALTSSK